MIRKFQNIVQTIRNNGAKKILRFEQFESFEQFEFRIILNSDHSVSSLHLSSVMSVTWRHRRKMTGCAIQRSEGVGHVEHHEDHPARMVRPETPFNTCKTSAQILPTLALVATHIGAFGACNA